jgi:hypothetical protein
VSRLLAALPAPIALFTLVPMAGAGIPDPTGAVGRSENFTQVVFGNPELLGP